MAQHSQRGSLLPRGVQGHISLPTPTTSFSLPKALVLNPYRPPLGHWVAPCSLPLALAVPVAPADWPVALLALAT